MILSEYMILVEYDALIGVLIKKAKTVFLFLTLLSVEETCANVSSGISFV